MDGRRRTSSRCERVWYGQSEGFLYYCGGPSSLCWAQLECVGKKVAYIQLWKKCIIKWMRTNVHNTAKTPIRIRWIYQDIHENYSITNNISFPLSSFAFFREVFRGWLQCLSFPLCPVSWAHLLNYMERRALAFASIVWRKNLPHTEKCITKYSEYKLKTLVFLAASAKLKREHTIWWRSGDCCYNCRQRKRN